MGKADCHSVVLKNYDWGTTGFSFIDLLSLYCLNYNPPNWLMLLLIHEQGQGRFVIQSEFFFCGRWNVLRKKCASRISLSYEFSFPFQGQKKHPGFNRVCLVQNLALAILSLGMRGLCRFRRVVSLVFL